jgi:uncharacterized phiE125 gp8 family phage protein
MRYGARPVRGYLTRTAAPSAPLLTTAEAKEHVRVEVSDDDALISALVQAATDHLDADNGILGRALISQTMAYTLPDTPGSEWLSLPVPRVQSITSITYYDADNAQQTFPAESYRLAATDQDATVQLSAGASWPVVYDRADAITVTYVTGYGDAASDVPQALRQAALLLVGHWYENREQSVIGTITATLPFAVEHLIAPYRVARAQF